MMMKIEAEATGFWYKVLWIYGFKRNTVLTNAVLYSEELFDQAKERIWVVAGRLASDLWANFKVVKALESAAERGVQIKIIFGPEVDPQNTEILRLHKEGKIHLHNLGIRPISQFIVVDEQHVRLEELHSTGVPRRAWVKRNTFMLGQRLASDFLGLLPEAKEIK